MKFIADEGTDLSLVKLLREQHLDVFSFAEENQSTEDIKILELAKKENRVIITRDKDFGELVYRMKMAHSGVILIRIEGLKSKERSQLVADFIFQNLNILQGAFVVLQAGGSRIRRLT